MAGAPDGEVGFEELYVRAGEELDRVPWASLSPNPALTQWLDRSPIACHQRALVIGCGLGDDAEELRGRGLHVAAFDVAPTAIARCQQRFPDSTVDYRVADLFALPGEWRAAFDLVVEIRTLQSLPLEQRGHAVRAIATAVRPGGRLFVRCLARDEGDPVAARPWPVSRGELRAFTAAGLDEIEFYDELPVRGHGRSFTVVYRRRD